jgi:hypothetical protein
MVAVAVAALALWLQEEERSIMPAACRVGMAEMAPTAVAEDMPSGYKKVACQIPLPASY